MNHCDRPQNQDPASLEGTAHELISCPRCRISFACTPTSISACWCIHEKISIELMRKLEGQFNGCLCRECLLELAAENAQ